MCGFIGRINTKGPNFAKDHPLRSGLRFLARRGPDSIKEWESRDGCVELLFARLAIVDTDSRAHQPLSEEASGLTLVFTGEIYNYLELRKELFDYPFKTTSDSEVLLAVFVRYGIEGLKKLRGMFAVCIVDERLKRVYLARDPIGKKPLFLARWESDILFGSSIMSLLAAQKEQVKMNAEAVSSFWKNGYVLPYASIFSGVTPVLPGQVLELGWQGELIRETDCRPKPQFIYKGEALGEVNETIRSLLDTAVIRRLTNNPFPTVLMSGGIDSTLVAWVADKVVNGETLTSALQVISLKSFFPMRNDEPYARYALWRLKTPTKLIKPDLRRIHELVVKALDLQDEPLGMISFFLLERLVNAASTYSRVLLSGDGGDEVFLGYGSYNDWRGSNDSDKINNQRISCGPDLPSWMSEWARCTVTDDLVGHMFTKIDRASAEQGIEIRCPLLDWDLMTYARSLPFESLTSGAKTKALLKDQLQGWPRWFLERPKVGFSYNLRWHWGCSNYRGLRETIDKRSLDTFESYLPKSLCRDPVDWPISGIFHNFETAWRLLVWSRFLVRLSKITV